MIYKCKMCGGELEVTGNEKVITCSFCGTSQTIPNVDEEKLLQLFNRATYLREQFEFEKASGIYEKIILDQEEQAEAYWGLCLCKYGIEYVVDPKSGKKIPTCHRTLTNSILKDDNYLKALELSDAISKKLYEEEALYIDSVQKKILEISNNEEPYDIFICYKETDERGQRTPDSVLAEDIYDSLVEKGYKVFFSKISLEDKVGQEYEPYIYAALTSSKIMLVIGTKESYFNAPWVKNEWSRFLQITNKGDKKYLIPCYKGISPYEMPEEFVNLQSQNLDKLGFMQDLLKGIDKLFERSAPKQKSVSAKNSEDDLLHSTFKEMRRMLLFVTDPKRFNEQEFCDKWSTLYTLEDPSDSMDPKKAPLAFSCDFLHVNKLPSFKYANTDKAFESMGYIESIDFKKLEKEEPELCEEIQNFLKEYSKQRNQLEKLQKYEEAFALKKVAKKPDDYIKLYQMFDELGDFKDSRRQAEFYRNKTETIFDSSLSEYLYEKLVNRISKYNTPSEKEEILNGFKKISDYKDAGDYIAAAEHKNPAEIENIISELKVKKQSLIDNNTEVKNFEELISNLNQELSNEIEKEKKNLNERKTLLEKEIGDVRKDYNETSQKIANCGVFAIKEKKMLREKLSLLEGKLSNLRRENNKQIQELENKSNIQIGNLRSTYEERITNYEMQANEIIDSNPEIKTIDEEIALKEKELQSTYESEDSTSSLSELWEPKNVKVVYDYYGFKILIYKLGKYPQSKVVIPSLVKELKSVNADTNGMYHLYGLEFCKINNDFYLIEPIEWKVIKHTYINNKCHYLLTTRAVLEVKGAMKPENIVEVRHDDKPSEYFTKEEHQFITLYKYSDIRKWLTNDFYKFAFNENEQRVICTAHIDNSAESTSDEATIFASEDTEDKVFLLSYRASAKTHLGDNFYEDTICMTSNSMLSEIVEKENSYVDDELIPSFGLDSCDVPQEQYNEEKNHFYEDASELCWSDMYSDYAYDLTKRKEYREGALLRSPDTVDITGYNTCITGNVNSYGGQYEHGNIGIINDILPCIILCPSGNEDTIQPDDDFDF